ncbi:hypothetical protein IT570_04655 [Candidatus Sumerlaeota bacterium]|nr:hypothetical protein [Candidatus Sumerlaeota bacterium]
MSPLQPKDERLLTLLLEQQQITPSQSARLRAQLGRGMEIHEALAKTPLVDALKLASIESIAANQANSSKEVRKPTFSPTVVAPAPSQPASRLPTLDDADLDLELDQPAELSIGSQTYQLRNLGPVSDLPEDFDAGDAPPVFHDLDEELEFEPHHIPGEQPLDEELMLPVDDAASTRRDFTDFADELDLPGKTPPPIHAKIPVTTATVTSPSTKLTTNFDVDLDAALEQAMSGEHPIPIVTDSEFSTLAPLQDKDSFRSPQKSMQVFNTADDEGINLIREVNEIFARVLDAGGTGFIIDSRLVEKNLITYDASGRMTSHETISHDRIDKIANRLKVMGRLEPWRRQNSQKGHFRIKHGADNVDVYLQTQPKASDKEVLSVRVEKW